jgi:hypothetical protein
MSVVSNNLLLAAEDGGGYVIDRSLRLRRAANAHLTRTFATGNRKTWTYSAWVKFGDNVNATTELLTVIDGTTDQTYIRIAALADGFYVGGYNYWYAVTANKFRDYSAWYHFVVTMDTTQAVANNRLRIYVNGVESTSFLINNKANLTQNSDQAVNRNALHYINRRLTSGGADSDVYLTEINFIDGQALTPSSFGETNALTGVWQPKAYEGTYGTNGFYLNFSDPTSTTTLTADKSGNGNNWTANNISLTSGATYDSMIDTPTPVADVRGNFCVINPTANNTGFTISNANLTISNGSTGRGTMPALFLMTTGKWYWEASGNGYVGGVCGVTGTAFTGASVATSGSNAIAYWEGGRVYWDTGDSGVGPVSYNTTDVIGVAVDMDVGNVSFYKNNVLQYTATFGSGSIPNLSAGCFPCYSDGASFSAKSATFNFGQRPFAYTPPSGFKALHTGNLPEGTITTSGTFTGNANADGPFIYLNGVPTAMTINGNAVTFGTHADKLANGFKVRSSSSAYNASGSNSYSITSTGAKFKFANAQENP